MEKYVYGTRFERETGLLNHRLVFAAALICVLFFFSASLSAAENTVPYDTLRFELFKSDEKLSLLQINTDYSFTANIPDASPSEVEVLFENPPAFAVFRSFEKTAEAGGTKLVYSVRFIKAGKNELPPARIRIRGKTYTLTFPPLNVFENPDILIPEFFFTAAPSAQESQSVQAGKALHVRLMGRYFKRIININRDTPEDALLEESALFFNPDSETKLESGKELSAAAVPVAEFIYTPFFEGIREFPHTEVKTESYNGTFYTVKVQPLILNVIPALGTKASPVQEPPSRPNCYTLSIYADNAAEAAPVQDPAVETAASDENFAVQLARLRNKERLAPAFWIFRRERKALEKKLLLENQDEVSLFWTLAAAAVLCILSVPAFVLLKKKRAKKIALCLCILGCFCILVLIKNIPQLRQPAVIAHKAVLRTIPEIGAQGSAAVQEGTRLKILHKSGDWYLTAAGERSGWILKSEAIKIQTEEDK